MSIRYGILILKFHDKRSVRYDRQLTSIFNFAEGDFVTLAETVILRFTTKELSVADFLSALNSERYIATVSALQLPSWCCEFIKMYANGLQKWFLIEVVETKLKMIVTAHCSSCEQNLKRLPNVN